MLYYLGKGTEFKKEGCKEYKKLDAALRAAAKDESLVVWDETGKVIGSLTDDVPEGALQTNPDGSVNTYDADGNKTGRQRIWRENRKLRRRFMKWLEAPAAMKTWEINLSMLCMRMNN